VSRQLAEHAGARETHIDLVAIDEINWQSRHPDEIGTDFLDNLVDELEALGFRVVAALVSNT